MKKRDYFILGILVCIVLYAALHRRAFTEKGADKINNLLNQGASSEAYIKAKDSIRIQNMEVQKGEI